MTVTFAVAVLVASLLGSVHCAAMCGAFTCFYSQSSSGSPGQLKGHAAYNLGRLLAYLVLGLAAGMLGVGLGQVGLLAGVTRLAPIIAASMMIAWGLHALLLARGVKVPSPTPPAAWRGLMSRGIASVHDRPPVVRAAVTGLATGLLPCGWLHLFVLTAAGTGSPLRGAVLMAVFWLGTLPMMLSVGFGLQRLVGPLRARLPEVAAVLVVMLGGLSLAAHLGAPGTTWLHRLTPAVPVASAAAESAELVE